jgi:hypothetical protein
MADQDRAVEVRGSVAVNGAVAGQNPDELMAQIEHTRQELAQTIDALAERVSPAHNLQLLRERAREQLARPEVITGAAVAGAAVLGLVLLRMWARRRR